MKILKEIILNDKQEILVIANKESTSMYILDSDYMRIEHCFGAEKDKFNFTNEELIELSKEYFEFYYKDIEILEEYWNNHDE